MSYTPRTGSVAHRAIEHLQGLGGKEVALHPLADAVDSDAQTVRRCLKPAVDAGALAKRLRDGLVWYRTGGGAPLEQRPDDDERDDAPITQRVVPAPHTNGIYRPALITPAIAPSEAAPARQPIGEGAAHAEGWAAPPDQEPKGLAGAARGPETAEETTPPEGAAHNGVGDDAKRDGGPASPGGHPPLRRVRAGVKAPPKIGRVPRMPADPPLAELKPAAHYECAAFSSGRFYQRQGDVELVIEQAAFETLAHYLQRTLGWGPKP